MISNAQIGINTNGRSPVNGAGRSAPVRTSNLGLTGCYNVCGVTHMFNKGKREECRARCDQQFASQQEQQETQQELLEQMLTDDDGGLSTGTIIAIIGSVVVLTVGGVLLIRYFKKKKA